MLFVVLLVVDCFSLFVVVGAVVAAARLHKRSYIEVPCSASCHQHYIVDTTCSFRGTSCCRIARN